MTALSDDIQERLDALPEVERNYYGSLLESAKSNPFTVMNAIRDGKTDPQYAMASHLALASINEIVRGEPESVTKTDQEALEDVQAQIEVALRNDDKALADRLRAGIENAANRVAEETVEREKIQAGHAEMVEGQRRYQVNRFKEDLAHEERVTINLHRRNGMPNDEAVQRWEDQKEQVASRLMDIHGITKVDLMEL